MKSLFNVVKFAIFTIALAVILSGCARTGNGQVDRVSGFKINDQKALVILGMNSSRLRKPGLYFKNYDTNSGDLGRLHKQVYAVYNKEKTDALEKFGRYMIGKKDKITGSEPYYLFELDEGSWFLQHTQTSSKFGNKVTITNSMLTSGTIAFDVKAGDVIYLGDYSFGQQGSEMLEGYPFSVGGSFRREQDNIAGAKRYLTSLDPSIVQRLSAVETRIVKFNCTQKRSWWSESTYCPVDKVLLD